MTIIELTFLLILELILSSVLFMQDAGISFESTLLVEESEGNIEKAITPLRNDLDEIIFNI